MARGLFEKLICDAMRRSTGRSALVKRVHILSGRDLIGPHVTALESKYRGTGTPSKEVSSKSQHNLKACKISN